MSTERARRMPKLLGLCTVPDHDCWFELGDEPVRCPELGCGAPVGVFTSLATSFAEATAALPTPASPEPGGSVPVVEWLPEWLRARGCTENTRDEVRFLLERHGDPATPVPADGDEAKAAAFRRCMDENTRLRRELVALQRPADGLAELLTSDEAITAAADSLASVHPDFLQSMLPVAARDALAAVAARLSSAPKERP